MQLSAKSSNLRLFAQTQERTQTQFNGFAFSF